MARQSSSFLLRGTIDNMTFYKTRHGYFARRKSSMSKSRIAAEPRFARLREQSQELGRTSKCGMIIRRAFRNLLKNAKDVTATNRLTRVLSSIIKADETNERGQRQIQRYNMNILKNFEFNESLKILATICAQVHPTINRASSVLRIEIAALLPKKGLKAPENATHFKLTMGAAEFDFANLTWNGEEDASRLLPINGKSAEDLEKVEQSGIRWPMPDLLLWRFLSNI